MRSVKKLFGQYLAKCVLLLCVILYAEKAIADQKVSLNEDNLVVMRGEVTSESVARVSKQILSSSKDELYLFISSPGGSIVAGQSLMYAISTSGKKVNCIVSFGASMAFAIFQSCHKRYVMPHSILMQHVASYQIQGQDPNNRSQLKFLTEMIDDLDSFQAKRLNMPVADFKSKTRDDWWLYGQSSVENKAADAVVAVSCSRELAQKTYKEKITVFVFVVDVEWSSCPLIESPLKVEASQFDGTPIKSFKNFNPKHVKKLKQFIKNLNSQKVINDKLNKSHTDK